MPVQTPFHPRTSALCSSLFWKEWAGYHAVRSYDTCHEREYHAIRHAAGLIDVTPLYKYDVTGPDAAALLSRVMVRNIARLKTRQVTYCCWCDDAGKVMDDGTVWKLGKHRYRVTAAEPTYSWLLESARGLDVRVEDITDRLAALALQGPRARDIVVAAIEPEGRSLAELKFFRLARGTVRGPRGAHPVIVTRTGYTGDLGYELWVDREHALDLWDAVFEAGRPHGIWPAGIDALDVTRVEAGFIMNGVDYFSAHHCLLETRKSTPYELGLGWTVDLERAPFIGQAALKRERARGSSWALAGVVYDWDAYEELHARFGLPPQVPSGACRTGVPIYGTLGAARRQIGYATTTAWSPLLKQYLGLATLEARHASVGARVDVEVTVEYRRHRIPATIVETPFYNPARKRA
ncbi:MAG: aminomethyl transferase family protein [Myxococcales bacterium]|nr:aminomethyltransferase family protein [Myxococcales bacterium]MCB9753344.1 aminomethyl transferase family protein [Myxococcales bacterium]